MLLTVAAITLMIQGPPLIKEWVERGYDTARPNAYVVSGSPELSPAAAWAAVEERVREVMHERLVDLANRRVEAMGTSWLPEFIRGGVARRWADQKHGRIRPTILDRDLLVRDHGFGNSYQAFFLVEGIDAPTATDDLSRRLVREERRFLLKCGGTVGWWGVLALAIFWIDRLSRGYMTGRLYALGALLGSAVPIALVMV